MHTIHNYIQSSCRKNKHRPTTAAALPREAEGPHNLGEINTVLLMHVPIM